MVALSLGSMMTGALIKFIATVLCLLLMTKLPLFGVEIDSTGKALLSAFVFGILNGIAKPIKWVLKLGPALTDWFIAYPIIFVLNIIIFALAAALVPGFKLRNKILDPVLGALLITVVYAVIDKCIPLS
ncbi:MAG: phage holin family protein [Acaryochloris sp. RU_4_1]|nr:phage holin family protein [Acaryochloris sp. RU_4_1]NJN38996.1 phage holin family protein [Acaryochloridaceae cyanobacterium CSU_3_4]NJR53190.1 phage holin family protein [Acaryochloris sp. CRU_2_0]